MLRRKAATSYLGWKEVHPLSESQRHNGDSIKGQHLIEECCRKRDIEGFLRGPQLGPMIQLSLGLIAIDFLSGISEDSDHVYHW